MRIVMVVLMAVIAMMMVMFVEDHIDFHARKAAALIAAVSKSVAGEGEFREFGLEMLRIDPEVEHGAEIHVAGYPREAIVVKNAHRF